MKKGVRRTLTGTKSNYSTKLTSKQKIVAGALAFMWLVLLIVLTAAGFHLPSVLIVSSFCFSSLILAAVSGSTRLSSVAGKIIIFAGVIFIINYLVKYGLDISRVEVAIVTMALISGIYLEKISPKQLEKFMLLAIATKIEFIIVAAFISSAKNAGFAEGFFPLSYWWGLVAIMFMAVPVLALKIKGTYRFFVFLTTFVAIILFIDFALLNKNLKVLLVASAAFLWPLVIERLIGRKVFLSGNNEK